MVPRGTAPEEDVTITLDAFRQVRDAIYRLAPGRAESDHVQKGSCSFRTEYQAAPDFGECERANPVGLSVEMIQFRQQDQAFLLVWICPVSAPKAHENLARGGAERNPGYTY
jgi:hypothetical protein